MTTILTIIVIVEAFAIGLAVGYAEGFQRARMRALKAIDAEMDDFIKLFNNVIDDVFNATGVELPKMPARKEITNGRNR